ncbi:NAD(P)H-dependent FMN reductase [Stackebrandtia endophytica]|uniref:NAD(P)H-dependent FMN reductase n=1 Tax=Stackebrandtia endophytica TaxID=1496996 RepID=A0A543AVS9_9ACTN|nr:NAD(P)H-dependent oxidoreductase [Stackebrandtia endophytica]TQL76642.1 NAD(P)H-dependent FMN reductase [Stackebrandtia endophytica]
MAAVAQESPVRIAVLVGSIRTDRFCPTPAQWIADQAAKTDGVEVDLIDLADHQCPAVLNGNDPDVVLPESVRALGERLDRADAFIVVSPVYNRSYPAALKNAVDWFYSEWQLKPVGLVSYGGITGGLHAIEHLRGVFGEFNAVVLRDSIMFANFWDKFDHDGRPVDTENTDKLATSLIDQLTWWSRSLREAKQRREYPGSGIE